MPGLNTVVSGMIGEGAFRKLILSPLNQFGRAPRRYLGPSLLPEQIVPANKYTETDVKYRTVLANHGTRYGAAVKKGNDIVGSMEVSLLNQDIAADFTSADYDNLLAIANINNFSANSGNPSMQGMQQVTGWYQSKITLPLVELVEKMRWEAIVSAQIVATGVDYSETVNYPNPAGQRVAAGGTWSSDSYDPTADFFERMATAQALGYTINRIIMSSTALFKLLNNAKVKAAVGGYISISGGTLVGAQGRITKANLNTWLNESGLPGIETYDLQYRTQTGTGYFLSRSVAVFACSTGRDTELDLGDNEYLPVRDALGYVGVGRPAGAAAPGRMDWQEYLGSKPPRLTAQAWQTTLPVITDPQSIFVLNSIA